MSRYKVGNLRLPNLLYIKIPKKIFYSAVRTTSRVHDILSSLITSRKF